MRLSIIMTLIPFYTDIFYFFGLFHTFRTHFTTMDADMEKGPKLDLCILEMKRILICDFG